MVDWAQNTNQLPFQYKKAVNADWYVDTFLTKVFEVCSVGRPNIGTNRLLLYHDNASAHTAIANPDSLAFGWSPASCIP